MTDIAPAAPSTLDKIGQGASAAAIVLGLAGLLVPRTLGRAYGLDMKRGETAYLVRVFSSRNVALGATRMALTDRASRQRLDIVGAGLNLLDAAIGVTAAQLTSTTRLRGPLTSLIFGAAAAA